MYQVTAGVEVDDDGRRVVCSVPLPVPPPVVFDAVATGEGISSWFVPCALEPQVGGRIVQFADPGAPDPTTGPEAAAEAPKKCGRKPKAEAEPAAEKAPAKRTCKPKKPKE